MSCNVCTFENPFDAQVCELCGSVIASPGEWRCGTCTGLNSDELSACGMCGHLHYAVQDAPKLEEPLAHGGTLGGTLGGTHGGTLGGAIPYVRISEDINLLFVDRSGSDPTGVALGVPTIIVDNSGSMSFAGKNQSQLAVHECGSANPGGEVHVVLFSDDVTDLGTTSTPEKIKTGDQGGTNLTKMVEWFGKNMATTNPEEICVVFVISDGDHNAKENLPGKEMYAKIKNDLQKKGYQLFIVPIAVGNSASAKRLAEMSDLSTSGGTSMFYMVDPGNQEKDKYGNIFKAVQSGMIRTTEMSASSGKFIGGNSLREGEMNVVIFQGNVKGIEVDGVFSPLVPSTDPWTHFNVDAVLHSVSDMLREAKKKFMVNPFSFNKSELRELLTRIAEFIEAGGSSKETRGAIHHLNKALKELDDWMLMRSKPLSEQLEWLNGMTHAALNEKITVAALKKMEKHQGTNEFSADTKDKMCLALVRDLTDFVSAHNIDTSPFFSGSVLTELQKPGFLAKFASPIYSAGMAKLGRDEDVDYLSGINRAEACVEWLHATEGEKLDITFLKKFGVFALQVGWNNGGPPECLKVDPYNKGFGTLGLTGYPEVLSSTWLAAHEDAGVDGAAFKTADGTSSKPFLLPMVDPVFTQFTREALPLLNKVYAMLNTKTTQLEDHAYRHSSLVHLSNGMCSAPLTSGSVEKFLKVCYSFKEQFQQTLANDKKNALLVGEITLSTQFPIDMVGLLTVVFPDKFDLVLVLAEIFARHLSYEPKKNDLLRAVLGLTPESLPSVHDKAPTFSNAVTIDAALVATKAHAFTKSGIGKAVALALRFRSLVADPDAFWRQVHSGRHFDEVVAALAAPVESFHTDFSTELLAACIAQGCCYSKASDRKGLPHPTRDGLLGEFAKLEREVMHRELVKVEEERLKQDRIRAEEERVKAGQRAREAMREGMQDVLDLVYGKGGGDKKLAMHVVGSMLRHNGHC